MGKFLLIFTTIIFAICNFSSSTDISCTYGDNGNYQGILGEIYQCEVETDPNINTKEVATINKITGFHRYQKSDEKVLGIRSEGKTIKYFPKDMEKIFTNLKVIDFYRVGMVEIHQSDLKPFPDLVVIYLGHNHIGTLESGLFDYNPYLKVIAFPYNGIKHIYGNIFDNLRHLKNFWFRGNDCIDTEYNSKYEIPTAIEYIKEHCAANDEVIIEVSTKGSSEEIEYDDNLIEHNYRDEYDDEIDSYNGTESSGGIKLKSSNLIIIGIVAAACGLTSYQ